MEIKPEELVATLIDGQVVIGMTLEHGSIMSWTQVHEVAPVMVIYPHSLRYQEIRVSFKYLTPLREMDGRQLVSAQIAGYLPEIILALFKEIFALKKQVRELKASKKTDETE